MTDCDLPLVAELTPPPDVVTLLRAFSTWPDMLLLDSALCRPGVGRYSFLMADPYAFHELATAPFGRDPFAELRHAHARWHTPSRPGLPPFQGGLAGLLSYELGAAWEQLPAAGCDEFKMPVLAVGCYDWVIAWDHELDRAWIISQGYPETDTLRRRERARQRLNEVQAQIAKAAQESPRDTIAAAQPAVDTAHPAHPPLTLAPQWPAPGLPGLTSNFTRDAYLAAVARAVEYIHAGDTFQVNLSQRLLYPAELPPLELYARLRARNPAPFAAYFAHDDWIVASASPERFVCLQGSDVETRPIKGTRKRPRSPEADLYTRDELRESEKDQAENVMIVDLLRNDLSRVCRPNTIRVPHLCRVETYETVQHLVSEIRGQLDDGQTAWDLLAATFPGGSITGAPKVRAMEIIAELEPTARGAYCGSLFYLGYNGHLDSSILIRTFSVRYGWIQCSVGGGIVAQSDPELEYAETLHKAEGMLRALR